MFKSQQPIRWSCELTEVEPHIFPIALQHVQGAKSPVIQWEYRCLNEIHGF
jgi:hypothetical protein